jgi:hypothetical protein
MAKTLAELISEAEIKLHEAEIQYIWMPVTRNAIIYTEAIENYEYITGLLNIIIPQRIEGLEHLNPEEELENSDLDNYL